MRCSGQRGTLRSATAWALEVIVHPGIIKILHHAELVGNQHASLRQHGDAIADGVERIEIMCYQEHGQSQAVAQGQDQLIERSGTDGIKSGRRLVKKQ